MNSHQESGLLTMNFHHSQAQLIVARGNSSIPSFEILDFLTADGKYRSDVKLSQARKSGLMEHEEKDKESLTVKHQKQSK